MRRGGRRLRCWWSDDRCGRNCRCRCLRNDGRRCGNRSMRNARRGRRRLRRCSGRGVRRRDWRHVRRCNGRSQTHDRRGRRDWSWRRDRSWHCSRSRRHRARYGVRLDRRRRRAVDGHPRRSRRWHFAHRRHGRLRLRRFRYVVCRALFGGGFAAGWLRGRARLAVDTMLGHSGRWCRDRRWGRRRRSGSGRYLGVWLRGRSARADRARWPGLVTSIFVIEIRGRAGLGHDASGRVGGAILATAASTTTATAARTHFVARSFVFRPAFGIQLDRSGRSHLLFVRCRRRTPCGRRRRNVDCSPWRGIARPLFRVQVLLGHGRMFAAVAMGATLVATIAASLLALAAALLTALVAITTTVALTLRLRAAFRARTLRLTAAIWSRARARGGSCACWLRAARGRRPSLFRSR